MSQAGGAPTHIFESDNYVWDTGTMSWIKMQQPILNAGSVTVGGTVTSNQGTANTDANGWPVKITDGTHGEVTVTAASALKIDGSAVTQPISATTLPLPTGASTSAKQPALGVAGTASADVITVQGITSMTPLKVDGSSVTQPVSGTVTANAGIGTFNTAHATTADARIRNPGDTAYMGDATTPVRVDPTGTTIQPISGTVTANQGGAPWQENITQFGGNPVVTGIGSSGVGVPRVTVSSDSNILVTQSGAFTVTANQGTNPWVDNISQFGGNNVVTGIGASGLGIPRVTVANDSQFVLPFSTRSDTFTTVGSGTSVNVSASPLSIFAIQVKGTGGAAITWDIRLEGSLDGVNYSQILQHTNATGDGAVLWAGTLMSPSLFFRSRVAGLLLGGTTNVVVTILGKN